MLTIRLTLLATVTGLALFILTASPALASSGDAAATQAYIHANYALVKAADGKIQSSEAALAALVGQVRDECPKAAAHSPQDHDSEQLSDEAVGAIVVAGVGPNVAAIHAFAGAAGRLHWSNHKLTSTIQSYVGKVKAMSALTAPSLCADIRAWVASGYQTLPANTVSFDAKYTPVWVALGELPGALSRFELRAEKGVVARSNLLEMQLTEYEARAVETYAEILDALELKQ